MDERCRTALQRMHLTHLIKLFEEKQIDYETLQLFHEYPDTIPSVLSNIGDQLKLRKGLKSILEEQDKIKEKTDTIIIDNIPITHIPSNSISTISGTDLLGASSSTSDIHVLAIEEITEENSSLEESNDPVTQHDSLPNNYIYQILQKTALGKAIIQLHAKSIVDNTTRCKLAELVIYAEYGEDTTTTINSSRFMQLAKWTVECFPGEYVETYYISSSERGKGRSASGKFYDAYTNLNRELRKAGLRKIVSKFSSQSSSGYITPCIPIQYEKDDPQLKKSLQFLQVQLEPWDQIKDYWRYTSSFRLSQLRDKENKDLNVTDYINKYPVLYQPGGHLLIEYDFETLFNQANNRMQSHWLKFASKLHDQLISIGIKEEDIDCDTKLLYNYPKLFSVVPVKIPNKRPWRASKAEIQEGFLVHIKVIGDLEKRLEDMKKTVQKRGAQLQLFPVIVGEDLKHITSSYVILDDRLIRVESSLRAIEISFKAYHALYCKYPVQSERLWIVIEKSLYGIEDLWENTAAMTPEVKRLITALKCDES